MARATLVTCVFGYSCTLASVALAGAAEALSESTVHISPATSVPQHTEVTVTFRAAPVATGDVVVYILFTRNGTFSEWAPLYAQSAVEYLPPPFAPSRGTVVVPSFHHERRDADGVFTFAADAAPGTYKIGADAVVIEGPNKKASIRLSFDLTVTPFGDAVDAGAAKIGDPRLDFDIVIAKDAMASEVYAAKEFQRFFAQASGATLPLVSKVHRRNRHVFIGPSEALRKSKVGFGVEEMGPEDLRIVIRDGNIAIAGGRPRGTLYGVYTFLEDYLGVRFLTQDHTHVPPLGAWPVKGPVDRSYHPPLEFRWSFYQETNADRVFAARLRCNTVPNHAKLGGVTGRQLINHSFGYQIPTKTYGREHPEYFALVDGKRLAQVPNDYDDRYSQPCLTNPDVLRTVTQAVLAEIERNPERTSVSLSQNDNDRYCRCPECAAIDAREGTPMGSLLTFVNAVADEVAKEYPNVKVGTLAYHHTRKPPKTIKLRSNVQIQLCSNECSVTTPINDPNCKLNVPFCNDLTAWGEICDDICIWYYNTNFGNYLITNPTMRVIEPNIRFFVFRGTRGIFMQGAYTTLGGEFSDLRNYLTSRLLWNPSLRGEDVMDEFLDLHYGRAAPPLRRFIHLVHDNAEAKGLGRDRNYDGNCQDFGLDGSIVKAGLDAFDEALRLARDEAVRARVEKASICAYRIAVEDVYTWDDKKGLLPPTIAHRTRPYVRRLFELCDQYGVTNMTESLTIDKRQDPVRPFPGWRPIFRQRFGLAEGESF